MAGGNGRGKSMSDYRSSNSGSNSGHGSGRLPIQQEGRQTYAGPDPDADLVRPSAPRSSALAVFLRNVLPGDWLKILFFVGSVAFAAFQLKGDVAEQKAQINSLQSQLNQVMNDYKVEVRQLHTAVEELKIEQARTTVLLERILAEQQQENRRK